jgi:hypothetical protein
MPNIGLRVLGTDPRMPEDMSDDVKNIDDSLNNKFG